MRKLKAWQVESLRKFLDRQESNAIEMSSAKEPLGSYYTGKADAYGVIAEMIKTMLGDDNDDNG